MRLYFHILRAHVGPFVFSFVTMMFIFLLQFLMKFIDQLVGKGLSFWIIGELIALNLAWMVILAVPMSVLVATLMAFGAMSSRNEVTAMKACGMSLYRMMAPVVIASLGLTYLLLQFNNNILPEANHRVKVLMVDIRRIKPTLTIEKGLFSQDIQGYSILARQTFENSNDLEGITIYDYTDPSTNVVVTAERGKVSFTPDYRKLVMDLYDGEIHQLNLRTMEAYRRMHYIRHRIIMNAEGFDFERTNENALSHGDRELSASAMQHFVDSLKSVNEVARKTVLVRSGDQFQSRIRNPMMPPPAQTSTLIRQQAIFSAINNAHSMLNITDSQLMLVKYNEDQIHQYLVEIHKKYSIPVACLVFVFVGAPLGIMARRGTFGVAASLSFSFFLLYWAALIGGEKLADRGFVQPWIGMWIANIVLGVLGIYLTMRMGRETTTIDWYSFRKRFTPKFLHLPEPTMNSENE
jgi:lipopolysaccharide export system permease protein